MRKRSPIELACARFSLSQSRAMDHGKGFGKKGAGSGATSSAAGTGGDTGGAAGTGAAPDQDR